MRVDVIGGRTGGERALFVAALRRQCRGLGVALSVGPAGPRAGPRGVTVVFLSSAEPASQADSARLQALVDAEALVLPVLARAEDAGLMPPALRALNAFRRADFGASWPDGLVDEVLGLAWLRRRTRKVFISYRRVDSEAIARQLFARLVGLGFEVFLDDVSIERGTNFQRELKWWMNDADLLLVLMSPNFGQSRWCVEELMFAAEHDIGALVVRWPQGVYGPKPRIAMPGLATGLREPVLADLASDDQQIRLQRSDFLPDSLRKAAPKYGALTTPALGRVVAACIRQRSAAIRQRLDNLLLVAPAILPHVGRVRPGAEFGDLEFKDAAGRRCLVRVLPFRPRPETLYDVTADAARASVAGCFYEECDATDRRGKALRWLAAGKGGTGGTGAPGQGGRETRLFVFCGGALL